MSPFSFSPLVVSYLISESQRHPHRPRCYDFILSRPPLSLTGKHSSSFFSFTPSFSSVSDSVMRLQRFFFLACLALGVAGKGWRVGYEKIFLWYAYQIDQLNPEDQRTIGMKCAEWDKSKEVCKDVVPKHVGCIVVETTGFDRDTKTPIKTSRPCRTVPEFLSHLDDKKYSPGRFRVSGGPSNPTPDIEEAVTQMHAQGWDGKQYRPWRAIKDGGTAFNEMIERVGGVIARTKSSMTAADFDTHKLLFDRATHALGDIAYYRRVDHMRYVVPALKEKIPGITVEAPVVAGKKAYNEKTRKDDLDFLDFNREETIRKSVGTIPDIEARLEAFFKNYYLDEVANDHLVVMESFETAKNRISGTSCSTT